MGFSRQSRALRRLAAVLATSTALVAGVGVSTADAARGHSDHQPKRTLKASLTGEKERPGPGDANGRGKARVTVKGNRICFEVSWRRIDAPTMAHIHRGSRNEAGPVVFLFFEAPGGLTAPVNEVRGCGTADRALVRAIRNNPRHYYVNVHNEDFPAGAIRGQLHR